MIYQRMEGNIAELALFEQRICFYVLACRGARCHLIAVFRCASPRKAIDDMRS